VRSSALAAVVGCALFRANVALASACCGDDGGLGQRLARDEAGAMAFSFSLGERIGGFDGHGLYYPLRPGDSDHEMRFDASWAVRVGSRFETGVDVPVVLDVRRLGSAHGTGGGVGDISAFGRVTIAQISDLTLWPALYATTSVFVPTGRPSALSTTLGTDTTGQGVAEFRTTLTLAKSFSGRWFAQIDGGISFFTPSDTGGFHVARAPRFRCDALTGPLFSIGPRRGLGFGVGVAYEAESPPYSSGPGATGVRLARLTASGSVDVTPRASMLASFDTSLPVSGLGANDTAAVAFSLGARYAFGIDD
jgi:hypothetical protein